MGIGKMFKARELSASEINTMPYVDMLAYMGESNLPPDGFAGIRRLIDYCHIHSSSRVLHVGSSAGFLSRELARITGCHVTGVDINNHMVESAVFNAAAEGLSDLCSYVNSDICSYRSNVLYDIVLTGGALAFASDHVGAMESMILNAKPNGFVALCELSYQDSPPRELRECISSIIENEVPEYSLDYWMNLASSNGNLILWASDCRPVHAATEDELDRYCQRMAGWAAEGWSHDAQSALASKIYNYMSPFNENMKYLSAVTLVFRNLPPNGEPLLYI